MLHSAVVVLAVAANETQSNVSVYGKTDKLVHATTTSDRQCSRSRSSCNHGRVVVFDYGAINDADHQRAKKKGCRGAFNRCGL